MPRVATKNIRKPTYTPSPYADVLKPDDELLSTRQAAELLGLSVAWFEKKRWERKGPPYIRRGRVVRYVKRQLLEWWAANLIVAG